VPKTVAPLPETEIRIVTEEGKEAKPGEKGVIYARGPQIMKGYYKRKDLTDAIIDEDGWLNTGDLGMWTHNGEYAICGRAKDTIVLSGGENIEPVPIEAKLRESEYIEQAVVLGQDKKFLAALIVPDLKAIEHYIKDNSIVYTSRDDFLEMPEVFELINSEVNTLVSSKNGFKAFEHIVRFKLIRASFEVGKELSAKQEVKRHVINEQFAKEIVQLFR
jgi:long-chain acyl-CoA synthetase